VFLRILARLAVVVTSIGSLFWVLVLADGNYCWSAFAFTMMACGVSAGILFLGVVPTWLRYSKTKQLDDKTNLRLAWYSFLVLVAEAVALQILPQRGE